uniref:Tetraspanin n=1 Tax=Mesocestoides corti TaxID=53468 RepID=A0A5K3ETV6_MESCO
MGPKAADDSSTFKCLKILHNITIIYMIVTSLCLVGIGSYLIQSFRTITYSRTSSFPIIPVILLAVGFGTILVCVLGIYGSKRDNLCMLRMYAAITCIVFILEICVAAVAFVMKIKLENVVINSINDLVANYTKDIESKKQMDQTQREFACCGADSALDYTKQNVSIPESCCSQPNCTLSDTYTKGCAVVVSSYFDEKMLIMSVSSFVASVGNAFAFSFALLYARKLSQYTPLK